MNSVQCGQCGSRKTILASAALEPDNGPTSTDEHAAREAAAGEEREPEGEAAEPVTMFRTPTVEENLTAVFAWLRVSSEKASAVMQAWFWTYGIRTPQGLYNLLRQHLGLDHTLAATCADYAFCRGPMPWVMVNWFLGQMPSEQRYQQIETWRRMGVPI